MKKIFLILFVAISVLFVGCKKEQPVVMPFAGLDVTETISLDQQRMALNYGDEDYRWFECSIVLEDYLDEECDGKVVELTNIFQVVTDIDSSGADVHVIFMNHSREKDEIEVEHSFWVGDLILYPYEVVVDFDKAFELINETNLPKPHSRHCVLRKEIGPKVCNPQYIFGNSRAQIYVDAVTGNVSSTNPVYDGLNLGTPLGEWP